MARSGIGGAVKKEKKVLLRVSTKGNSRFVVVENKD